MSKNKTIKNIIHSSFDVLRSGRKITPRFLLRARIEREMLMPIITFYYLNSIHCFLLLDGHAELIPSKFYDKLKHQRESLTEEIREIVANSTAPNGNNKTSSGGSSNNSKHKTGCDQISMCALDDQLNRSVMRM